MRKLPFATSLRYILFIPIISIYFTFSLKAVPRLQGKALVDSLITVSSKRIEDTNKVKLLANISYTLSLIDYNEGLRYGNESEALSKKLNWEKGKALAYRSIAYNYMDHSDNKLALANFLNALEINIKIGNKVGIAANSGEVGAVYNSMGNYAKALEYIFSAASLHHELGNKNAEALDFGKMGNVYTNENDYPNAIASYQKAKKLFEETSDSQKIGSLFLAMGNVYYQQNLFEKSIESYMQSLSYLTILSVPNKRDIALNYANMGSAYTDGLKDFYKGAFYHEKALGLYQGLNDPYGLALCIGNLGVDYLKIVKYHNGNINRDNIFTLDPKVLLDSASTHLKRAIQLHLSMSRNSSLIKCYEDLAQVDSLQGDYKAALSDYMLHSYYKDLVYSPAKMDSLRSVELKHQEEVAKQEMQIEKLKSKSERNNYFVGFAFFFIIACSTIGFVLYNRNLSIKKRLVVENLNSKLAESNKIKEKLFSIISHDLRQPLTSTFSLLSLLGKGSLSAIEMEESSNELATSIKLNLELLDNLLNWTALQMKGSAKDPTIINIDKLIQENVELLLHIANMKKISLTIGTRTGAYILADINMTRVVIRNLLSNAIKFTGELGRIDITYISEGNMLKIIVADSGNGIEKTKVKDLLSGRLNESSPGTNFEKGFGIGLMLCKEFVEENGGEIFVESNFGNGSRFMFTIPLYLKDPAENKQP